MLKKASALLVLCIMPIILPAYADTPIYQRIDFQTDVEKEIANDLLSATLSIELNNKNPALLAKELTTITNESLKLGASYTTVKLTSGNQQTYPIYNDKNKITYVGHPLLDEIHDFNVIFDEKRVSVDMKWHHTSSFIDVIIQPHETVFVLCADGEAECLFAEKTYRISHWDGLLVSAVTKQEVFRITAHSPCHIGIVVIKHL